MQKITTFLWFNHEAEEAVNFYTSIFKNASIDQVTRYGKAGPGPEGAVMVIGFQLDGQKFIALNGGPIYKFTPAISLVVDCKDQAEVDNLWDKLCEGGRPDQCGWLQDKYGLSWQIVPGILPKLMGDKDPEKAKRVTEAMFMMKKIDIAALQKAYDG